MNTIKHLARKVLPRPIRENVLLALSIVNAARPLAPRECNICGHNGTFKAFGRPLRIDARCPRCGSLERHRLLMLALETDDLLTEDQDGLCVLHFAPEAILESKFRKRWKNYQTADLFEVADLKLNLEAIELPDSSVDLIVANHVLEHVDDLKTAREFNRILRPGGVLLCMVPIVEGWDSTYENPAVTDPRDRWLHFGQGDHVRYFGRDFRQRIESGGFTLFREVTAQGDAVIRYGLLRGEKLFCFRSHG